MLRSTRCTRSSAPSTAATPAVAGCSLVTRRAAQHTSRNATMTAGAVMPSTNPLTTSYPLVSNATTQLAYLGEEVRSIEGVKPKKFFHQLMTETCAELQRPSVGLPPEVALSLTHSLAKLQRLVPQLCWEEWEGQQLWDRLLHLLLASSLMGFTAQQAASLAGALQRLPQRGPQEAALLQVAQLKAAALSN